MPVSTERYTTYDRSALYPERRVDNFVPNNILKFRQRPVELRLESPVRKSDEKLLGVLGFDPDKEVLGLRRRYREELARGLSPAEAKIRPIEETMTNSNDVHAEYSARLPVLPQHIVMESGRLKNSKSGYRIVDMISEEERQGAVLEAWVLNEKTLDKVKEGDTLISISPTGKTGIFDKETGGEFSYSDLQLYAVIKGWDGVLRGVTFIVSGMTYGESLELYQQFGESTPKMEDMKLDELDRVSEMVRRPVSVKGGKINFEMILDEIQSVKGGEVMRVADGVEKTFDEARELLKRIDEIEFLPEDCKGMLEDCRTYLDGNIENIEDPIVYDAIKQRLKATYLRVSKKVLGEDESETEEEKQVFRVMFDIQNTAKIDDRWINDNFAQTMFMLSRIPGCMGSSTSTGDFLTGQSLGDILSGGSNIISFSGALGSTEAGGSCKVCGINSAVKGGCGYCHGCAKKAA